MEETATIVDNRARRRRRERQLDKRFVKELSVVEMEAVRAVLVGRAQAEQRVAAVMEHIGLDPKKSYHISDDGKVYVQE